MKIIGNNNKKRQAKKISLVMALLLILSVTFVLASSIIKNNPNDSFETKNNSEIINLSISTNAFLSANFSFDSDSINILDGLVGVCNFDNNSLIGENETNSVCWSPYGGINATLKNGLNWVENTGKFNSGSLNFTGTNYSASSPRQVLFDFTNYINSTTDNYTVSIWINPNPYTATNDAQIFSLYGIYDGWLKFYRSPSGNGGKVNYLIRNGTDQGISSSTDSVPYYQWTNILIRKTYDGTYHNERIYINGINVAEKNVSGTIIYSDFGSIPGKLGAHNSYSSTIYNAFNGSMDDLMAWNRSLSDSEIKEVNTLQLSKYNNTDYNFISNQSFNYSSRNINASVPSIIHTYNFCFNNGSDVCLGEKTITQFIKLKTISANFSSLISAIRNDFYGTILQTPTLFTGSKDTDCDGISETLNNYTFQQQAMLDSGLKSVSFDLSLAGYYDGMFNLDFEDWTNDSYGDSQGGHNGMQAWYVGANAAGVLNVHKDSEYFSGASSTNITYVSGGSGYLYRDINIKPNKEYNLTIMVKGTGSANMNIKRIDNYDTCNSTDFTATGDWQAVSILCNWSDVPTINNKVRLNLIDGIGIGESFLIDHVTLTEDGANYTWWRYGNYSARIQNVQFNRDNGITTHLLCAYTPLFLANLSNPDSSYCIDNQSDTDTGDCMVNDLDTFNAICIDAYQQVDNYQNDSYMWMWNEPYGGFFEDNLPNGYAKTDFVTFFNSTYQAVKEYNPNIKFVAYGDTALSHFNSSADITNFTRMMWSNLSEVFNETHRFSFHPYTDHYINSYSMSNGINVLKEEALTYGIEFNEIWLNEWSPTSRTLKNQSNGLSREYKANILYPLLDIFRGGHANTVVEMTYHWDDATSYFNCPENYHEYPSFWSSISEAGLDNPEPTYYPAYTEPKKMSQVCQSGGNVYQTTEDSCIISTSCNNGEQYGLILQNICDESYNISELNISGVYPYNNITNLETGEEYLITADKIIFSSTNDEIMDSYQEGGENNIVYLSSGIPSTITSLLPLNNTYINNATINFTANLTDDVGLNNATLNIYNGTLIEDTIIFVSGEMSKIQNWIKSLADGVYTWWISLWNDEGKNTITSNQTLIIDTINSNIDYSSPTLSNGAYSGNSFYINYTTNDTNDIYSFINSDNSLVGFWRFENEGTDDSGNSNDLTLYNNVSSISNGRFGNAYDFDDIDDYMQTPSLTLNNTVTFSLWFKSPVITEEHKLMVKSAPRYDFYTQDAKIKFRTGDWTIQATSAQTLQSDLWYHLVGTYNGTTSKIYINGIEDASQDLVRDNYADSVIRIGKDSGLTYTEGIIDDILIFNRSLSAEEVLSLYNSTSNFHNFTNLEEGEHSFQSFAIDQAGNINNTEIRILEIDNINPAVIINISDQTIEAGTGTSDINATCSDTNINQMNYLITNPNGSTELELIGDVDYMTAYTFSSSLIGYHNITVFCNDSAGNENTTISYIYVEDIINPVVNITYPLNINYTINVSQLNYTIVDETSDSCWYSRDNGVTNSTSVVAGINFTELTSVEGNNTWIVYCNDTASNENQSSVTFFKDTINPVVSKSTPISGLSTTSTQILYTYMATDTNVISNCSLVINDTIQATNTSVSNQSINHTFDFAYASRGFFNWSIQCYDNYGNLGTTGNIEIELRQEAGYVEGGSTGGGSDSDTNDTVLGNWSYVNNGAGNYTETNQTTNGTTTEPVSTWSGDTREQMKKAMDFTKYWLFEKGWAVYIGAFFGIILMLKLTFGGNKKEQKVNRGFPDRRFRR